MVPVTPGASTSAAPLFCLSRKGNALAFETVLLVTGQETAREVESTLLRFSYRVLTADSGRQALRIVKARAPVELVLSETLIAEGMSGISLAARLRVSYPSTSVMLMAPAHHQAIDPSIPLLIKPFAPSTLIVRVHQVLANARRSTQLLTKTFEASRAGLGELVSAASSVAEAVRQSRQLRIEGYCSRLRTAVVRPTVVVAEDDPPLRYTVCSYLGLRGFRVLEASDGQEVLHITREHAGPIDVLVTDFRMPGLDGLELARTIAAERPQTNIIFMTGEDLALPGRTIRKPFDLDDLLTELVGVLVDG